MDTQESNRIETPSETAAENHGGHRGSFFDRVMLATVCLGVFLVIPMLIYRHPGDYRFIPSCPMKTVSGILCPGCGSVRALHFLLRGEVMMSLRCNVLMIPMSIWISVLLMKWYRESFLKQTVNIPYETKINYTFVAVFLAFFLLRNIPLEPLELLRPPTRPPKELRCSQMIVDFQSS